jgi:hypothetical protein
MGPDPYQHRSSASRSMTSSVQRVDDVAHRVAVEPRVGGLATARRVSARRCGREAREPDKLPRWRTHPAQSTSIAISASEATGSIVGGADVAFPTFLSALPPSATTAARSRPCSDDLFTITLRRDTTSIALLTTCLTRQPGYAALCSIPTFNCPRAPWRRASARPCRPSSSTLDRALSLGKCSQTRPWASRLVHDLPVVMMASNGHQALGEGT